MGQLMDQLIGPLCRGEQAGLRCNQSMNGHLGGKGLEPSHLLETAQKTVRAQLR